MVAIEVNFLTGRYVATAHHDRRRPEWPPAPARLFSAFVATWADADDPDASERQALEWLEAQPPPAVAASEAVSRKVVSHFVPVNDASVISPASYLKRAEKIKEFSDALTDALFESEGEITRTVRGIQTKIRKQRDVSNLVTQPGNTSPKSAVEMLPSGYGKYYWREKKGGGKKETITAGRPKQERSFPSVTPDVPRVTYLWSADPPAALEHALDGLLARVTRLGHSSSLVSCRLTEDPPAPNYVPGEGSMVLRSVRRGQLAALERAHSQHQATRPRTLPFTTVRYRASITEAEQTRHLRADMAGEWILFEFTPRSRTFPAARAVEVSAALRKTVFRYAADPLSEALSGHEPAGAPSSRPHVGFLALPWVGHAHADGRLMGVAIGIPDGLDRSARHSLFRAIGVWEQTVSHTERPMALTFGRRGVLELERLKGPSALVTLRPGVWRRPSRRWVSATPVALPAHPGRLTGGTASARAAAWRRAEQAVVDSCLHVGLPEPADVVLSLAPFITGALPALRFPAFQQRHRSGGEPVARRLVHASVVFDRPLAGPLLLGSGRYVGLGLMRPVQEESDTQEKADTDE